MIFAGCSSQPPPHRPMWSMFESAVSDHGSFLTSRTHFLVVPSCDVTSAKLTTESDCASVSGQAQVRPCTTRPNHHAATAIRLSEVDASGDALSAPITVNNNASTLGMGRRIMAERRSPRTGRGRQHWARARVKDDGRNGNGADASLRAFVRALARQAARECFQLELKQRSPEVQ